ncbi:MAG TPA: hypothetical protein VF146_04480, partial [Bryobacteraceae bacterium]
MRIAPEFRGWLLTGVPEALRPLLEACLGAGSRRARVRAARAVLQGMRQPAREQLGRWIAQTVPVDSLVPEMYAAWRPVVRDGLQFIFSQLSTDRLAEKLVEQCELSVDTAAARRMLVLISKMPGIQKLGQVIARHRHLGDPLRQALAELENGMSDVTPASIRSIVGKQLGSRLRRFAVKLDSRILS